MAAAAGRLYAVHCLWWVRRTGRERCKGKGRERRRIICASISRVAAEGLQRRERCRLLRQIGEEGGEADSSLALYANQQDPRAQMSHDREEPAPCSPSRTRGAVSAQRWCHDLFWRKWCQASAVRLAVLTSCTAQSYTDCWCAMTTCSCIGSQEVYIQIHRKHNLMMMAHICGKWSFRTATLFFTKPIYFNSNM